MLPAWGLATFRFNGSYIIHISMERPQEVAEGPIRRACPLPPRYFVGGAEVDTLVDADLDHIVSHILEAATGDRPIYRGAKD